MTPPSSIDISDENIFGKLFKKLDLRAGILPPCSTFAALCNACQDTSPGTFVAEKC